MKFYSTNNRGVRVSLRDAVVKGLAPDNGLYMPETIPILRDEFIRNLDHLSLQDVALEVSHALIGDEIPGDELKRIVNHTIQFDAPVVEVEDNVYALELFHGPTLAFKDFGARFMSQLLRYFASQQDKEITILVATSGDTGSAVANGFLGVDGTRVVVLYPSGKVSDIQEKQFTTLGQNITALEVKGTFDDCQALVKKAFLDKDLQKQLFLTSANSINIARLIPQSFYYFHAFGQVKNKNLPVVFSVPSGNFGNLTGGLIAKRMGLPVHRFLACTNANDVVPEYLKTKLFSPRSSVATISNAMDVGNPSNFTRLLDLYSGDYEAITKDTQGYSFTDEETSAAMYDVLRANGYLLDPHGAIGYLGIKAFQEEANHPFTGIFLETAHPGKFKEVVEEAVGGEMQLPSALEEFQKGEKQSIKISSDFASFKELLVNL
jgi:threonine synthase